MYSFFFYCYGDHRDLHSFPTRRSSDLSSTEPRPSGSVASNPPSISRTRSGRRPASPAVGSTVVVLCLLRSEEHTSELQSQFHLVCRLLLEKKKKKKN